MFQSAEGVKACLSAKKILGVIRDVKSSIAQPGIPSSVCKNSLYIVDISSLTWKDILADVNGTYINQGMYYWNFDREYRCVRA